MRCKCGELELVTYGKECTRGMLYCDDCGYQLEVTLERDRRGDEPELYIWERKYDAFD